MERVVCLLIGYVFGLFETSYFIGKIYKTDIRQHGSGNAGTTNALRTFGRKAGALTLLGDCMKCIAAVMAAVALFSGSAPEILPLLKIYAAAGCILGHNFPFYMGFRGGKGFAASVGMAWAIDWRLLLICLAVFLIIFFTMHYVSLGAMICYVVALVLMIIRGQMGYYGMDQIHLCEFYGVMLLLTILIFWRHKENIKRLLAGTESKVYLSKSTKKKF
ncbi:MAG: glycerol-3-phosphate 1-O-acyltransferase PlsY [Blautia sp.]|nr:glycerol-3-phosphate 1-O-acyltransferase PlsY [Blautia sp.]